MVLAFDGVHARSQIKSKVDQVATLYTVPQNRGSVGVGDVMVAAKVKTGPPEMEILDCLIAAAPDDGTKPELSEYAAVCALSL